MELPQNLVESSNLTSVQIESLASYLQVASHEKTLKQAAEARSSGPVRVGSYYKTVQQGKKNIESSVFTLVVALWMGFVKADDLHRLLSQVGKGLPELEEEEADRVGALVSSLVTRIVM